MMTWAITLSSPAHVDQIGGYIFEGTAGTQSPNIIADVGEDTNVMLMVGGTAQYSVDVPFSEATNTSLDVSGGLNDQARQDDDEVFKFSSNVPWPASDSCRRLFGRRKPNLTKTTNNLSENGQECRWG